MWKGLLSQLVERATVNRKTSGSQDQRFYPAIPIEGNDNTLRLLVSTF
jgi:hypothetical protein